MRIRAQVFLGSALCVASLGGCTAVPKNPEPYQVFELAKVRSTPAVRDCLLKALAARDPDTRAAAAIAVRDHLWGRKAEETRGIYLALIDQLSDARPAHVRWPGFLTLFETDLSEGSVRAQALVTLTMHSRRDYGFEQAEWRTWLDSWNSPSEAACATTPALQPWLWPGVWSR
jgi:hypothetical protein